jgi:hypothetical protein
MQNTSTNNVEKWVYEEMEVLFRERLIPNYPCEWVSSGNELTRFEIAYYIKTLITNELDSSKWQNERDITSQIIVEALRKLVAEFRSELTAMGVKVTNIDKISPDLDETRINNDFYQDLDVILSEHKGTTKEQNSYYYFGQYINEIYRKSFLFLPGIFVKENNRALLQGTIGTVNIVCHPNREENPPFLIIKGDLPVDNKKTVSGYYLFPLDDYIKGKDQVDPLYNLDISALDLLDEVDHVRQVENLWQFNGPLSLEGYSRYETQMHSKLVFGELNKNFKIGSYLISTDTKPDLINMGLPFFNSAQSLEMDLDTINHDDIQPFQINIQGNLALNTKTSISGELELLYRGNKSGWDVIWPSDTKAEAGIEYKLNDYWAVLSYQSFVNSQTEIDSSKTTSFGVEYNNWVTLWLAYQILSFEDSRVTGALTFRF